MNTRNRNKVVYFVQSTIRNIQSATCSNSECITADELNVDLLILNRKIDINIIFSEGIMNIFKIINYQFKGRNVDKL